MHKNQKKRDRHAVAFWVFKFLAGRGSIGIAVIRLAVRIISGGAWLATISPVVVTPLVVMLSIPLILSVADGVATQGTETSADGCAFKAATALIADDAACRGTAERTDDRACLGIGTGGARN
jgi:hypothetical protein